MDPLYNVTQRRVIDDIRNEMNSALSGFIGEPINDRVTQAMVSKVKEVYARLLQDTEFELDHVEIEYNEDGTITVDLLLKGPKDSINIPKEFIESEDLDNVIFRLTGIKVV